MNYGADKWQRRSELTNQSADRRSWWEGAVTRLRVCIHAQARHRKCWLYAHTNMHSCVPSPLWPGAPADTEEKVNFFTSDWWRERQIFISHRGRPIRESREQTAREQSRAAPPTAGLSQRCQVLSVWTRCTYVSVHDLHRLLYFWGLTS